MTSRPVVPPGIPSHQGPGGSTDLHRLLVDRVLDYAIFALDPTGHILTWNSGAQRLKQYRADEIIGKHFSIFYPEADLIAGKPAWELEVALEDGQVEDEGWRIRKDGSRFWANVLITALRDDAGTHIGFAKVTRDLTDRRAVAELERRSMQAESANRAKSQFLAAMSHELRTPLNAIGGYAQLMQLGVSGPVTEEQLVNLCRIQRSQQHLLGIINDILNFSRIEAGQVACDIRPVELSAVADAVAPMVAVQADAKRVVLEYQQCEPGIVAAADRAKLEQVLLNLLSNAVKFTPEGGHISLSCGSAGGTAWLSVKDDGIGIPADELESIFSPFVQVGRDLANPKEGTGLGLAISRDLARAMHGDLQVESAVGAGSTFTITLPRATGAPEG